MKPLFLALLLASSLFARAEKLFDWQTASEESVQLDPALYHTGRVYRPGSDGGNMHIQIRSQQPVTVAMAPADEWSHARQDPGYLGDVHFRCQREHVVNTIYECHLPPSEPMALVIRDERYPERPILKGIGVILGGSEAAKNLVSPNAVTITYFRWACVDHCFGPEFRWVRLFKEKYELTASTKIYSLLTPERDGQSLSVKIKAPVPMLVAVLPSRSADHIMDDSASLPAALAATSCKQRGVQNLSFECELNLADGPQSLVLLPEQGVRVPNHKKAEIELQAVRCVENCENQ